MPAHGRLRDALGAQVREIRPHREGVDVPGLERGERAVPEHGGEKRHEAGEVRGVRGAGVGGDAAFVGQVAVEREDVRGEGGALYDGRVTVLSSGRFLHEAPDLRRERLDLGFGELL